jgi:quercetin dioxygenase-like cupin family protein
MSETFTDWNTIGGREVIPGLTCWASTGTNLQLVKSQLAPGTAFTPHSHPHEQFLLVLGGTFECLVNETAIRSGPGGVFHFAPDQPHGGRVVGDQPVVILEAFHPIRRDYAPSTTAADHDTPR